MKQSKANAKPIWKKILSHPATHIFCIVLVSLAFLIPYFSPGFFPTHDGEWAVVRLSEMFREIKDGQFPARYSIYLNNGYGYPLFNFAYPFPYYAGLPLAVVIGYVNTIKLIFALTLPASGIGMYLAVKKIFNDYRAGLIAGMFFMIAPYRMVDLYVRGSIGESVAFALAPFLLYFGALVQEKKNNYFAIGLFALTLGALITSHNIMGLYFTPIIFILLVIYTYNLKERKWKSLLASFILGIGLSSFFIIPAITEKSLILLSVIPIADRNLYWVKPAQLIIPSWGYGVPPQSDAFTYQLGIGQILIALFAFFYLIKNFLSEKKKSIFTFPITVALLWIICCLMMFEWTATVWESTPLLKEINYPWTLLGPLTFLTALLSGFVLLQGKIGKTAVLIIYLITIVLTLQYARAESQINFGDMHYQTNDATTTSSREYTPLWVKTLPDKMPDKRVEIIGEQGSVTEKVYTSDLLEFEYNVPDNTTVRINTIYYPGWIVYKNGEKVNLNYENQRGVMEINVSGNGNIKAVFQDTTNRTVANIISLLSLSVIIFLIFLSFFKWVKK